MFLSRFKSRKGFKAFLERGRGSRLLVALPTTFLPLSPGFKRCIQKNQTPLNAIYDICTFSLIQPSYDMHEWVKKLYP